MLLATVLLTMFWVNSPAWSTNLLEVYRLARNNDPIFEAARYTLDAAEQKIPEARAGLLPTVNMNGNDLYNNASTTFDPSPTMSRNVHTWTWTLQLIQPLIRMQNLFAYQESEYLVEQAMAQFDQAKQDLILRVVQTYFGVVSAQEGIAAAEAQVIAMEEQLAQSTHGYQAGTHAVTDVYEARSRLDLATAQLVAARNDLASKRADLEKIVGPVSYPLAMLRPAVVIPKPQPNDIQAWTNQAQENNPTVRAQKAALAVAEAEIRRSRAEHLPTLDLTASYGKSYSSGSLTTPTDYTTAVTSHQAGVQFNIPIFAGGGTTARVTKAIANKFKVRADMDTARRQVIADARQAYAGIENGLSQVEALESTVDSSKSSVKGNRAGFKLGIRMNIDVLNAEQQLYAAKSDLVKARYDALFQGFKLKAAAGILAVSDVAEISAQLEN
ncbi:MAG: TolC family outer membrane protein [Desulfobulbaceae bacterium]|nr:TolC family outer membrane protein [Desulfobulbaceae bacterium]